MLIVQFIDLINFFPKKTKEKMKRNSLVIKKCTLQT